MQQRIIRNAPWVNLCFPAVLYECIVGYLMVTNGLDLVIAVSESELFVYSTETPFCECMFS